jgi:hypothetical protein
MSVRSGEHRSLLFSTEFIIGMLIVLICYTHFLYLLIPILNMFEKSFCSSSDCNNGKYFHLDYRMEECVSTNFANNLDSEFLCITKTSITHTSFGVHDESGKGLFLLLDFNFLSM